ncbi:hypothetical protein [Luteibacter sahnii]|uniref:hypothetical protein n=1 Tax=Luteibacter sahnii TaxID=3021977 RepID=UPI002A7513F8|nr:hypothetical protein [Luteibacter sp. PPL193]MDY1550080.1 hypothetical protein [Luteibacter sp. PPL193]
MKHLNYVAAVASLAMTVVTLSVFSSTSTASAPLTVINGTHVTDLAPIVVYAHADDSVAAL